MIENLKDRYIRQLYDAGETLYEANMPELTEEKFALFAAETAQALAELYAELILW